MDRLVAPYSSKAGSLDSFAMLGTNLASDFRASLDARTNQTSLQGLQPMKAATESAFSSLLSPRTLCEAEPSTTAGLRDRLLREARIERQRCLAVAGMVLPMASWSPPRSDSMVDKSVQTDPVRIVGAEGTALSASSPASSPMRTPATTETSPSTSRTPAIDPLAQTFPWNGGDDNAQEEALAILQAMGERGNQAHKAEGRVAQLEREIAAERAGRQELEAQWSHERGRKDAAQQQVLCLEYELDGKEATLQVAERALERRDNELQQAQLQLTAAHNEQRVRGPASLASLAAGDDSRFRALRSQVLQCEQQLGLKDEHILKLLAMLRQNRGLREDDLMTACGSERSAVTASSAFTTASYF